MTINNTEKLIKKISNKLIGFLESLDENQKSKLIFDFSDDERYVWYYTPHVQNGLLIFDMKPFQRNYVYDLMKLSYSIKGYETSRSIIDLETILGDYEGRYANKKEGGSGNWVRSPERYWIAIFGDPYKSESPWGFRIGGHHIGLTVNVIYKEISIHPLYFGANPAKIIDGPRKGFRALALEEDYGRELITSLPDEKRNKAIVSTTAHDDILTMNYRTFDKEKFTQGIIFSDLSDSERDKLIKLIDIYINRFNDTISDQYRIKINKVGFENTYFAWAGSINESQGHYYSIKHDNFLIEYDNTQNNANHIHSVLRDFASDYGEDLLSLHYKSSHSN